METRRLDEILTPEAIEAVKRVFDTGLVTHATLKTCLVPASEKLLKPEEWDLDYLAYALEYVLMEAQR
jgi:hypothetical protein